MSLVTSPDIERGETSDGRPALLLHVGPDRWPVLIAPDDFDHVTTTTGFHLWGIQRRNVVVGDANPMVGRPAVARLLCGFLPTEHSFVPAFRDGNPLNLLRSNLGIRSPGGKVWWLKLRPGEHDPAYTPTGTFRVPAAILRYRPLVPEPHPRAA